MTKLLIGGSPCTYWSVCQKNNRETEASGIGWELFGNYLIAKQKFQPDFFLYENNKSAAEPIKEQIKRELNAVDWKQLDLFNGCGTARYIEINSALVSAQQRKRFYVHNCGEVGQPKDRGILLRDILEMDISCRDSDYTAEPIQVGAMPRPNGELSTSQAFRIYSVDGKSVTQNAGGGGAGGKGGLYAVPIKDGNVNGKFPAYEVKNGKITIKDKKYHIKLADGFYIIRKPSVAECARLQTMPDDYCRAVSNAQAYKGLGNGWTAEVIIHILNGALKNVPRDEEIVVLSMYDGIGTGRYCLDKMGFTNITYYAYEIDKYATKIAMSNYPDIIQCGDAFKLREDNWVLGF